MSGTRRAVNDGKRLATRFDSNASAGEAFVRNAASAGQRYMTATSYGRALSDFARTTAAAGRGDRAGCTRRLVRS